MKKKKNAKNLYSTLSQLLYVDVEVLPKDHRFHQVETAVIPSNLLPRSFEQDFGKHHFLFSIDHKPLLGTLVHEVMAKQDRNLDQVEVILI